MSDFQLTYTALVGARPECFQALGLESRRDLAMRRVAPDPGPQPLATLDPETLRSTLRQQLPIWIHNIICDHEFPQRHRLMMSLRRFEGELNDNRDNELISRVLSSGFRGQPFDPLDLPEDISAGEKRALRTHIETWRAAFSRLEEDLLDLLGKHAEALDRWCRYARHPDHQAVE